MRRYKNSTRQRLFPCEEHQSELSRCDWLQTKDADTQMDQLIDTIKKEAGEAVLAHMEERLVSTSIFILSFFISITALRVDVCHLFCLFNTSFR